MIGAAGTDTVTLLTDGSIAVRGIATVLGTGTGTRHRDPADRQQRSAVSAIDTVIGTSGTTDTVTLLTNGTI